MNATDSFTAADGTSLDGRALDTGLVSWSALVGTWTVQGNLAYTSTASSSNPMLVIDATYGNIDVSANVSASGGDALYYRVVDASNWLRTRLMSTRTSYSYTTYTTTVTGTTTGGVGYDPPGTLENPTYWPDGSLHTWGSPDGQGTTTWYDREPTTQTSYSTSYTLVTEKCVSGVVSSIGTATATSSTTTLRVVASGTTVTVYGNGTNLASYTVSDFSTATKVGVGRGGSPSYNGSALDNFSVTTQNRAPDAPTLVSPSGGTLDITAVNRFTIGFNDPDAGDSLSKFTVYYREIGAGSWTSVTDTTGNNYHDFAASTFTADVNYEWQAEAYDSLGQVGTRSGSAQFATGTPPAAPTITAPTAAEVIDFPDVDVTWTATTQTAYQARVVDDNAGSPDTSKVEYDTGSVSGTSTAVTLPLPTDNVTRHVQVRVADGALWSAWADVEVTVQYAPPAAPTVAVSADNPGGDITLVITNPTPSGDEPAAATWDIYRRPVVNGTPGTSERIVLDSTSTTYVDATVANRQAYEYMVTAKASDGTQASSDWTPSS